MRCARIRPGAQRPGKGQVGRALKRANVVIVPHLPRASFGCADIREQHAWALIAGGLSWMRRPARRCQHGLLTGLMMVKLQPYSIWRRGAHDGVGGGLLLGTERDCQPTGRPAHCNRNSLHAASRWTQQQQMPVWVADYVFSGYGSTKICSATLFHPKNVDSFAVDPAMGEQMPVWVAVLLLLLLRRRH